MTQPPNQPQASNPPPAEDTLIEFPCQFPIKVMGESHPQFSHEIIQVIQTHLPEFGAHLVETRGSANGKYTSLTCMVYVTSKPQLDAIYHSLTVHPRVKVVL